MRWTLDKNGVRPDRALTESEQSKLNDFMGLIQNKELHPSKAAAELRCNYKKIEGTYNQFEIYLSHSNRATFIVDEVREVVTMLQVGGHT